MTKCQKFPLKPPRSTSWNDIVCGLPSNVLHFPYFSSIVAKFPQLRSETSTLYVRKSKPPFLYKDRADHRQGHGPWQPITHLQLTSLATDQAIGSTRERERKGERERERHLSQRYDYTTMLLWAYQNIFGSSSWSSNNEHEHITSLIGKQTSQRTMVTGKSGLRKLAG